jgi:hypothetical protein
VNPESVERVSTRQHVAGGVRVVRVRTEKEMFLPLAAASPTLDAALSRQPVHIMDNPGHKQYWETRTPFDVVREAVKILGPSEFCVHEK